MDTWKHLPQEYWEMVHSSVREDLGNRILGSKGLTVPEPPVDAASRRLCNPSRMAELLADHRSRQPTLQGNYGAADGSSSGVVGGERSAAGVVGQKVGEDDSQVGRSHSDAGSGEPEDMEEDRGMFEEAEEEAEEGTVEIVDESDEGSEIEDVE